MVINLMLVVHLIISFGPVFVSWSHDCCVILKCLSCHTECVLVLRLLHAKLLRGSEKTVERDAC